MPAIDFLPFTLFRVEFQRRLETVDVHAQSSVEFGQLAVGKLPSEAIVSDDLTDNVSVFLFNVTLVITPLWPPSGERNLLLFTVGQQFYVDEFSPVIGI